MIKLEIMKNRNMKESYLISCKYKAARAKNVVVNASNTN